MNWITDGLFALSILGTFIIGAGLGYSSGLKEGRVIGYRQGLSQGRGRNAR